MSTIQFACPSCNAQYKVPDKAAGRQATCKSCGASMTVPNSNQASASGTGNADLSALYASAEATGPGAAGAPGAFGGSVFATSKRSGPSPMLLAGIGGGVVVLLLVVILVVVLTGDNGSSGSAQQNSTLADGQGNSRRVRPGENTNGPDEGEDSGAHETDTAPVIPLGELVETPGETTVGVPDWTLEASEKIREATVQARFRGMVISLPPGWQAETVEIGKFFEDPEDFEDIEFEVLGGAMEVMRDTFFGDAADETASFNASPREALVDVAFEIVVERLEAEALPAWPVVRTLDEIDLSEADAEDLQRRAAAGDLGAGLFLGAIRLGAEQTAPVGFNPFKTDEIVFVNSAFAAYATFAGHVEFGTLFGGYPFARALVENAADETLVLIYTGRMGNLQVTFTAQAPDLYPERIEDMDWMIRSARLMNTGEVTDYRRTDRTYASWVREPGVEVPNAGSTAPYRGLEALAWAGFPEDSLFNSSVLGTTVTPYRQPYGIIAPEGMKLASTNRVAARWFPEPDGMWLELKVTKLKGRNQQQMQTPVMPAGSASGERLFAHSVEQALPDGYAYSSFDANGLKVHRVLFPEMPGHDLRKVYYIVFDGPSQVTVEGRFHKDRPEDLESLDAAAQTLSKAS